MTGGEHGRRGFLRGVVATGAVAAFGCSRCAGQRAGDRGGAGSFANLSAREAAVLAAAARACLGPARVAARESDVVRFADQYLNGLPPEVAAKFHLMLRAFDLGPVVFSLRAARFTSLSEVDRAAHLEAWRSSRFAFRRAGFNALKTIVMLGYYSQDATWSAIGYAGPVVPRGWTGPGSQAAYDALHAPATVAAPRSPPDGIPMIPGVTGLP